ncbi:MAG: FMN-binding protein [Deltaproteobacteria bacterium]|jgi:electron transport complex protein RnfG|nr:FMN-binding protein [Deltaproteobacteria bacterium]
MSQEIIQDEAVEKESLWQLLGPVVVLTVICAVAGTALAGVKLGTASRIESQVLNNVQGPTLQRMFPNADNDIVAERKMLTGPNGQAVIVFPIYEKGQLSAVAIEGIASGYGGDFGVMTAFNLANDTMNNIGVTISKETPGIGSQVATPRFTKQFRNGAPDEMKLRSQGGKINAISGATISSTAASNAVQQASAFYRELKPEIGKTWPASR